MAQALSERTIALVKATVPALEAHGLDIVREMYSRMFQNPEIRDLFNHCLLYTSPSPRDS